MAQPTILINLDRCTGCWTCAMACKTGNDLPDDTWRVTVRTLGSGEGIDRPSGVWPNLKMSWMPVFSRSCIVCPTRTDGGKLPYCVHNCPNKAMWYGDLDDETSDVALKVEELRDRNFRLFRLPSWENSKEGVVYASKRG